jgi:hypothetical protein
MRTATERFEEEFLADTDYAEEITYYTNGSGVGKSIYAIIFRNKFSEKKQFGDRGAQSQRYGYDYEIQISRGSALGISTIIPGMDRVEIPLNIGDTILSPFNVRAITLQDGGSFRLGLSK